MKLKLYQFFLTCVLPAVAFVFGALMYLEVGQWKEKCGVLEKSLVQQKQEINKLLNDKFEGTEILGQKNVELTNERDAAQAKLRSMELLEFQLANYSNCFNQLQKQMYPNPGIDIPLASTNVQILK